MAIVFTSFISCSSDKSSGDIEPPVIITRYPDRGATDIPVNTNIIVTFNKSVININQDTVYLQKLGATGKIPVTIAYHDETKTLTIDPVENLDYNTIYYFTLDSGIRSKAGVALLPDSWSFVTGVEEDTEKPSIVEYVPNQDYYVNPATQIYVIFSEPVNNIGSSTIFIKDENGDIVPATVDYDTETRKTSLSLQNPLNEWKNYTLYCTDEITDNAGNHLDYFQFSFKTDDTHNPQISTQYPEENATDIPTNAVISVTFSESINPSTIQNNFANFKVEKWTGATWEQIDYYVIYNDDTKTALCYPQLESNKEYKITLSNNIRDLANNPLDISGSEYSWTFTTKNEPDITPPEIVTKNPDNNQENIPLDAEIIVTLNEDVQNVSSTTFSLERAYDNQNIAGVVVYNSNLKQAIFTPSQTLEEGVWYRVSLSSSITDMSGNALTQANWLFKTVDTTKPNITYSYPSANTGNVPVNAAIQIVFSEDVIGANEQSIIVTNETTAQNVSGSVTYISAERKAVFEPDTNLDFEQTYKVRLVGGSIKDLSNNTLDETAWYFQTAVIIDTEPPVVVSPTYPDHQTHQTDIPVSTSIRIYFNEPVTGIGPASISLKRGDANGEVISGLVYYDPINLKATFVPDNNLEYETTYTVIVKGGQETSIQDASGNKVAQNIVWSFTTTPDTTQPVIVFKTPEQGTPDIPGNAVQVMVIFSEQVQNVNTNNFKLVRVSDNQEINSSIQYSYNPQTNIASATLTPTSPVEPTGEYRVILTNGIIDLSANHNQLQPVQWTFYITALDLTAPGVVIKNPDSGQLNWNNRKVTVVFSEDVKGVNSLSFYLKDQSNETVPVTVLYNKGLLTAELEVVEGYTLPYETQYTAYLTGAITDLAGNPLQEQSWSFETPQDNIPPTVVSVYPPQGTTAFPVNGQIYAVFSEPIQGYNSSSFYLTPAVSATITYDAQTNKLTLIPQSNLQGETTYTVTITTDITDCAQNPNHLQQDYTWQFTTQPVPDNTPPEVILSSRNPAPDTTGVSLNPTISLQFTEHVVNATTEITLKKGTTTIPVNIDYNNNDFSVTITPVDLLEPLTTYTVIVPGGTNGIRDAAGNYMQSNVEWSFTTQNDTTSPVIIDRYPVPNATNVPLKPVITVVFNEPVTGVNTSSFTLTGSNVPNYYVMYDEATRTATLTPGSNLQNNSTYTVTLFNTIKDRYNNALQNASWTFTTASLPVITNIAYSVDGSTYTTIADNATGVNHKMQYLLITFNRPMNTLKEWMEIYEGSGSTNNPSPLTPGAYTWSQDGTQIVYNFVGQCKGNQAYKFKLYGWGGSFDDTDGNVVDRVAYVGDGILNITTGADSNVPLVIETVPYGGVQNVGRDIGKIILRFNEMMNVTRDSRITISPSVTATRLGWIEGGRTVVFTIPQLNSGTTYTVTLNSGTNSFQDIAGNTASGSFSFTTGTSTGSTLVFIEGFENYNNPYFDVYKNVSTDDGDWERLTTERAGNGTWLSPQEGSYFVRGAYSFWNVGSYADINTISSIDLSNVGSYILEFKMFHERLYNSADTLQVLISVDGINYSLIEAGAMGTVYRYDWSCGDNNPVWQTHYVDLSPYTGTGYSNVKIKLRAFSTGERGGNIIIDDLKLYQY